MTPTKRSLRSRTVAGLALVGMAAWLTACSETGTTGVDTSDGSLSGDNSGSVSEFSSIPLSQASGELARSGLRIEVRVKPGSSPLVASELALDHPNMAAEPERVEANITALDLTGTDGTITTDLGGLELTFDGATEFAREGAGSPLSLDQFAAAVTEALAAGNHLHIVARRAPPATPQAPDDATFLAARVGIAAAGDGLKIDLNVDQDNLQLNGTPPPDAFLKLLGLTVELRVSEGITRIGHRREPPGKEVEFEGLVKAVNLDRGSFTLGTGVVVRLTDQTTIASDDELGTLAAVARALAAGFMVKAHGKATVESLDPRVLVALRVEFERHRPLFEFREGVKAVDVSANTLTLTNGAVLCLNDQTVIDQSGELKSLADVAAALEAGKLVGAAGVATPAPNDAGCRALVLKVRFGFRPPPAIELRDLVKAADPGAGELTLASGVVLCLDDHSTIDPEGDFKTLEEVARALAAGTPVAAWLLVTPAAEGAGCRAVVLKVRFVTRPPALIEFHDGVKAVDPDARTLTLQSGATLCFDEHSQIDDGGELASLADVAAALAAGKAVSAHGVVTPGPTNTGCRATVIKVRFELRSPQVVEFADVVTAVDVAAGKVTLAVGASLCLGASAVIVEQDELNTLADVAAALAAGQVVVARGKATPGPTNTGCRATVLEVKFDIRD